MLRAVRFGLVLVVALTIQSTWMADLAPFGVPGDLLLLVSIAGGLAGGAQRGAVVGFCCGMAMDAITLTPLGLSALAYLTVGYCVGSINEGVLRSAPWIPVVTALGATVAGIVFYVLLGQLVGQQFRLPYLPRIVVVTALLNAVLVVPVAAVMRWVERAAPPVALGLGSR